MTVFKNVCIFKIFNNITLLMKTQNNSLQTVNPTQLSEHNVNF